MTEPEERKLYTLNRVKNFLWDTIRFLEGDNPSPPNEFHTRVVVHNYKSEYHL